MKREDIEFLKELQNDIKQNAYSTIWVVEKENIIYGEELINPDGIEFFISSCESIGTDENAADTLENLKEYIEEFEDVESVDISDYTLSIQFKNPMGIWGQNHIEINLEADWYCEIKFDIETINEWIGSDIEVSQYEKWDKISDDTFFLRKKDCEEFIKNNRYHYKNPRPCDINRWRSPDVERLFRIIKETDWSKLEEEENDKGFCE